MLITNITYFLLLVYLVMQLKNRRFTLFNVFVFLLPFQSWYYNVGLTLYANQFVILLMITKAIIANKEKVLSLFRFRNKLIIIYLFYVFIVTFTLSNFFIPSYMNIEGFFRSEGRYIAQLIIYMLTFSIIPLAFIYLKSFKEIFKCVRTYLNSLLFLSALGWLQYVIYNISGLDIFPIGVKDDNTLISGVWDGVFRISSLGGDPKALSLSLVIGFFIMYIFNKENFRFFKLDSYLRYVLILTAFATFSTSGIVVFVIIFIFVLTRTLIIKKKYLKTNVKKKIYSFLAIVFIGFVFLNNFDFISIVIQERVINRDITREDFDAPILTFLSKSPEYLVFGSGLGNIHNLAFPYIRVENLHYMDGNIFVAKSGYLRIISELGLFGLLLFSLMTYSIYRRISLVKKYYEIREKKYLESMQLILAIVFIVYLSRSYVFGEFILFLSITNILGRKKLITNNNKSN